MKLLPWMLLLLVGCGLKPVGRPYNEAIAAKLPVGTATTSDVKTAMGAPYRAQPMVSSEAPEECPSAREWWVYTYEDYKENTCTSSLYFDESAKLCGRTTKVTKRGPACSGAAP